MNFVEFLTFLVMIALTVHVISWLVDRKKRADAAGQRVVSALSGMKAEIERLTEENNQLRAELAAKNTVIRGVEQLVEHLQGQDHAPSVSLSDTDGKIKAPVKANTQ